ncbi:hypothetical protein ACFCV3_39355 [Kribbella sp. NPDC056345]|uniref:hypothetical protein n=1 Tax=Kribbella sp. NPDC056345 TaxID=3345789 RepID=UPI0035D8B381
MGWKALAAGSVLTGTAAGAALVTLGGYRQGFRYGGDAPPFVLSITIAVVACSVGAFLVHRQARVVGRRLLVIAVLLWIYLAATAVAVSQAGIGGQRDVVAWAAVLLQATGHILPVGLLEATFLVALAHLSGVRVRRIIIGVTAYSAAYLLFELMTTEVGPYEGMAPLWRPDGVEAWSWLAATPWMATVVVGPAIIWRSLARTTRENRQQVLLLAMVSLVPVATIVFCLLSGLLAFGLELLPASVGEAGLAIAFGIPFIVCPPALVVG